MIDFMVYFGLADKIVGVCRPETSQLPTEYQSTVASLPVMAELWPTEEVVWAAEADLFAASNTLVFSRSELGTAQDINDRGMGVFTFTNATAGVKNASVDAVFADIENMGKLFNIQDKTNEYIAEKKAVFLDIADKAAAVTEKPTVLFLLESADMQYYISYGAEAIANAYIESAGADLYLFPEPGIMSNESIIEADPDVIVLGYTPANEGALDRLTALPEFQNLSAVQSGRIVPVAEGGLINPGFTFAGIAQEIAAGLYPEIFN
jgi:iron complex transport system substrate-binding protein